MQLKAGQKLKWESISDTEARIVVETKMKADSLKALGFGNKDRNSTLHTTADWMREIRAGE